MSSLTPTILFLILFVNPLRGAWDLTLKKNTIVVDLNDSVNLRSIHLECPVDKDTKVTWHNSGSQLNGRTLIKYVMENRDGGNYTCLLEDGTVVDYKVVLVHDHGAKLYQKIVSESRKPITCEAKNYTGQFSCSWKAAKSHDEFIFEAHRGSYPITCDQPTRHGSTYAVNCHDTQSCNYAEEDQNIVVVLHAIASKNYENHTHSFLLRDITKPDPPNDLGKLINNTGVFIKWKYPKTWCNVHSFFPLIFNVNVTDINKGHSEHHPHVESTEVSTTLTGKFSFCVQARDMYYKSSWSDWSCYMVKPSTEPAKDLPCQGFECQRECQKNQRRETRRKRKGTMISSGNRKSSLVDDIHYS